MKIVEGLEAEHSGIVGSAQELQGKSRQTTFCFGVIRGIVFRTTVKTSRIDLSILSARFFLRNCKLNASDSGDGGLRNKCFRFAQNVQRDWCGCSCVLLVALFCSVVCS